MNSWQNIILVTCACVYKHCFRIKEILQLYYCTYIICPPIVDFPASVNKIKNEFSNIRSLCLSLSLSSFYNTHRLSTHKTYRHVLWRQHWRVLSWAPGFPELVIWRERVHPPPPLPPPRSYQRPLPLHLPTSLWPL